MHKLKNIINTSKYVKTHKQQNINQTKSISNNIYDKQVKHLYNFFGIYNFNNIEKQIYFFSILRKQIIYKTG